MRPARHRFARKARRTFLETGDVLGEFCDVVPQVGFLHPQEREVQLAGRLKDLNF